ncbi:unnamed protein product [Echinostoma caproni]|uniref:Sugar phosphate exchanger 3 n=1 Tax=Echinostoma caproni TaxID=27848 RepID=A0A183A923_9TREM|nr:unnamed protein product [Echinostoma caproni]
MFPSAALHAKKSLLALFFALVKRTNIVIHSPCMSNEYLFFFKIQNASNRQLFDSEEDAAIFLGLLDSLFMFSYALGLYVSGWLGDRFSHRKVLFGGSVFSALIIFLFGYVTEISHFYNKPFYCVLWILNGLTQSTVWPSAVAILNSRAGSFRGFVLGTWSSCASAGNIIGDLLVGVLVPFGYHYGFLVPSVTMFAFSFMLLFGLSDKPYASEHTLFPETNSAEEESLMNKQPSSAPRNVSFWRVFAVGGVIFSSLAYACIKLVNYALFFWLTFYLTSNFGWSNSDASTFSVWYDVGGILGGVVAGLVSDLIVRYMSRNAVILLFSVFAVPTLLAYRYTPPNPAWLNGLVMGIAGLMVGGPAVLISTVVIRDLSETDELSGARTQATIAGIIDGTGSLGASLGQILIPYLAFRFGWSSAFYLFMTCMILTCFCVLPLWIKQRIKERHRSLSTSNDNIYSRL